MKYYIFQLCEDDFIKKSIISAGWNDHSMAYPMFLLANILS